MTHMVEEVGPTVLVMAAGMTADQHRPRGTDYAPGTCRQCMKDGCPQLEWAHRTLDEYRQARAAR